MRKTDKEMMEEKIRRRSGRSTRRKIKGDDFGKGDIFYEERKLARARG